MRGFAERQARQRVVELVERQVARFRSDEELWPIRIPREPLLLEDIVRQALPDDHGTFDIEALRQRVLMALEWKDGSRWELWILRLPSGLKVFCDSGGGESRILATGGRHSSEQTDRLFLEHLAASGGERFGIEMAGGAPVRVRAGGVDRELLVSFFVDLFEVTRTEGSVRAQLEEAGVPEEAAAGGTDFRHGVASWLDFVASKRGSDEGRSPCISAGRGPYAT